MPLLPSVMRCQSCDRWLSMAVASLMPPHTLTLTLTKPHEPKSWPRIHILDPDQQPAQG